MSAGLSRRRLVRVPASSANLGPGFDAFGAALSLYLELEVRETGTFAVHTDLELPRDRTNLVIRAFERLHPAGGFDFTIKSGIPLSGGLGSSAAAILAGLLAADHLFELDADVSALATELEGHSDNVAAALHGGFVVSASDGVHRFEPPMGLEAVLVVPHQAVPTDHARTALPDEVPLQDAVFNIAHGSLLMAGVATSDWELIAAGLRDRLHQPRRAHLYPRSAELVGRAPSAGALGATISGAGPSVLVWCRYDQTRAVIDALRPQAEGWATVMRARFEPQGADVREL